MIGDGEGESGRGLAAALRLRPERPAVMRLSRRVLVGLAAVGLIGVLGAVIWALQGRGNRGSGGPELFSTDNKPRADGLGTLPRDYAGLPRDQSPKTPQLGPPLPGDLGRPMLSAPPAGPSSSPSSADADRQRLEQEREAARTSKLFAGLAVGLRAPTPAAAPRPEGVDMPPGDSEALQNMQERKLAFVNAPPDRRTVSGERLQPLAGSHVLQAGAVIPAALITGIRSDLPGQVVAQVTENVFDTPTGRYLLVPQGARLVGLYDSQVAFGQNRVLLVWTRLILPNGHSLVLDRLPAADVRGYAGLEDRVDNHWGRLFTAAILSTILGIGAELGSSASDDGIVRALRRGSQDSLNQAGQQAVRRNLNIQPTLTIRPGFAVRVLVNRDLVLAPYRGS